MYITIGNWPLETEELNPFLYTCCQLKTGSWYGILIFGTPWNPQMVVIVSVGIFLHERNSDTSYFTEGQTITDESKNIGNGCIPLHSLMSRRLFAIQGPGRQTFAIFLAPAFWAACELGQVFRLPHSYISLADTSSDFSQMHLP